jgi:hypothetical protein
MTAEPAREALRIEGLPINVGKLQNFVENWAAHLPE